MIDKVSVQECAICGACINACPVDAISLDKVHLDFRYPQINEDICIHCSQCEKACPILGNKGKPSEGYPVAFAAKSENDPMRMRSSSGGAFYELADQMLRDGGYVCGAVFDDKFHVKHILSNAKEDMLRMMGSKYAQSDVGYCYREVKDVLEKGCKVLFSGCPCPGRGTAYISWKRVSESGSCGVDLPWDSQRPYAANVYWYAGKEIWRKAYKDGVS